MELNGKTYAPIGFNQNGQMVYAEKSAGVPGGFSYLTSKVNTGTGKQDSTVKWNLSIPIVAMTDTDCACAGEVLRTIYASISFTTAPGSTTAERTAAEDVVNDLIATTQFKQSVIALTQPSS